jgi:hypothetical protein
MGDGGTATRHAIRFSYIYICELERGRILVELLPQKLEFEKEKASGRRDAYMARLMM